MQGAEKSYVTRVAHDRVVAFVTRVVVPCLLWPNSVMCKRQHTNLENYLPDTYFRSNIGFNAIACSVYVFVQVSCRFCRSSIFQYRFDHGLYVLRKCLQVSYWSSMCFCRHFRFHRSPNNIANQPSRRIPLYFANQQCPPPPFPQSTSWSTPQVSQVAVW